jgi:hypothetical protein
MAILPEVHAFHLAPFLSCKLFMSFYRGHWQRNKYFPLRSLLLWGSPPILTFAVSHLRIFLDYPQNLPGKFFQIPKIRPCNYFVYPGIIYLPVPVDQEISKASHLDEPG